MILENLKKEFVNKLSVIYSDGEIGLWTDPGCTADAVRVTVTPVAKETHENGTGPHVRNRKVRGTVPE